MSQDPYQVVRDFEVALCEYPGAPFAVTTTSCTMALLLAVAWHFNKWWSRCVEQDRIDAAENRDPPWRELLTIEIPKRTYMSVPMSVIHAGCKVKFREENWRGAYQLKPLPVWDCARMFTGEMYHNSGHFYGSIPGAMLCVSFHTSKILGDTQGGAILHGDPEADAWLRRARFDGRTEGIDPKDDTPILGWHAYMSVDVAARLLLRLRWLPRDNPDLPNDDYPDLSLLPIFQ